MIIDGWLTLEIMRKIDETKKEIKWKLLKSFKITYKLKTN